MALEVRIVQGNPQEVPPKDFEEIADLLNQHWGSFFVTNPHQVITRMASGDLFFVGYEEGKVTSVFETLTIRSDSPRIPEDGVYPYLTGNGTWNTWYSHGKYEILVFVDVAANGKGNGKATLNYAIGYLARKTRFEHFLTNTPDISMVQEFHISMGAELTQFRVPYARLGYRPGDKELRPNDRPEDVVSLSYSKKVREMRASL